MIVYVLYHCDREDIEGVYLHEKDAQDMANSFGESGGMRYAIEEHGVIE